MSKKYEELFELLDEKYWIKIEAGQCTSCFAKNALKETHNYVVKIEAISYTVPVGNVCIHCGEIEFEGSETILPSMGDRAVIAQRRHANRDLQAIQARWTKRQINRTLRQIHCRTESVPSKI